tara:strand:- start:280 stop:486 length:207 start_codon:yes stop_codon:yes gene_type:complete
MLYTYPNTKLEQLRGTIASVKMDDIRKAVLQDEIDLATSRLEPRDTGHLHDYIARLNNRLEEINGSPK